MAHFEPFRDYFGLCDFLPQANQDQFPQPIGELYSRSLLDTVTGGTSRDNATRDEVDSSRISTSDVSKSRMPRVGSCNPTNPDHRLEVSEQVLQGLMDMGKRVNPGVNMNSGNSSPRSPLSPQVDQVDPFFNTNSPSQNSRPPVARRQQRVFRSNSYPPPGGDGSELEFLAGGRGGGVAAPADLDFDSPPGNRNATDVGQLVNLLKDMLDIAGAPSDNGTYQMTDNGNFRNRRPPPSQYSNGNGHKFCAFCKRNGETREFYSTHILKDSRDVVICPILRKYMCPLCKATGDRAHTLRHCPLSKQQVPVAFSVASSAETFRTRRSSNGRLRKDSW
jgi:hypothetical protein